MSLPSRVIKFIWLKKLLVYSSFLIVIKLLCNSLYLSVCPSVCPSIRQYVNIQYFSLSCQSIRQSVYLICRFRFFYNWFDSLFFSSYFCGLWKWTLVYNLLCPFVQLWFLYASLLCAMDVVILVYLFQLRKVVYGHSCLQSTLGFTHPPYFFFWREGGDIRM